MEASTLPGTALGRLLQETIRDTLPVSHREFDEWYGRVAAAFLAGVDLCPYCSGTGKNDVNLAGGDARPVAAECWNCAGVGFSPKDGA